MDYQVLARKWRPQIFSDVVGQQHIIKTLQSELMHERMAHAYLFVGPRGIGKTTIARVFSKAMNCLKAPVAEPCCECENCLAIANGNCLDVIEIDGASNNSVEDIRKLREEVFYSPVGCKYKIYIIDEVHMLSNQAWNALLKTIEEPPPHAKFLFATTEAHKVLTTVVSRCQRFDLQRITFSLITEQLNKIAQSENVSIEPEAIDVIARAADGGMRDAQSLLDQMIAFASVDNSTISAEQTLTVFGLTGIAEMEQLIVSMLKNDKPNVIVSIYKLSGQGKNLEKLFEDVLLFLRGVQISLIIDDPATILEVGSDVIELYVKTGKLSDSATIQKLLEFLSPVGYSLHDALNKQVFLETILLKGMRIAHSAEIDDLIARLNQLRGEDLSNLDQIPGKTVASVKPVAQEIPAKLETTTTEATLVPEAEAPKTEIKPEEPPAQPIVTAPAVTPQPISTPVKEPAPVVPSALPEVTAIPAPVVNPASSPSPVEVPVTAPVVNEPQVVEPSPVAELPIPAPPPTHEANPQEVVSSTPEKKESLGDNLKTSNASAEDKADVKVHILENPKSVPDEKKDLTPDQIWHLMIKDMEHCNQPLLKNYMQGGRPTGYSDNVLTVVYDDDNDPNSIEELNKQKSLLELKLKKITDNNIASFNLISKEGVTSPHEVVHLQREDMSEVRERAESNKLVVDTMDLFDGSIVDVKG